MPSFITVLTRAENMKCAREAIVANPNDPDALVDIAKLRKLDPKLAAQMDQYRKEYVAGFITTEKP